MEDWSQKGHNFIIYGHQYTNTTSDQYLVFIIICVFFCKNCSFLSVSNRWGYLEIKTNPDFPDTVQAYAAGFAEGVMTSDMIYKSYR